ncbi:MAG TPA: serine hydrolase domain-containing protein [Sphingobium sp.]
MAEVWQERLGHFKSIIEKDVADGLYYGASVRVARHGHLVFSDEIGHADCDATRALRSNDVFSIFSMTKAFTNILVLRRSRWVVSP